MKQRILLIGGCGYVGSALQAQLNTYDIDNVDLDWHESSCGILTTCIDYRCLNIADIQQYHAVILLAGHSSVRMCLGDPVSAFNNNVRNFVELTQKLSPKQKFIYASSASVYGATPKTILRETDVNFEPLNEYYMTKLWIDQYVQQTDLEYYGLRFGTVCGWAPHTRIDVMINAMTHTAMQTGEIHLFNGDVHRSLLGINDLCNSIKAILKGGDHRGIYNLAGIHATSRQIATYVGNKLGVPVIETEPPENGNIKLTTKAYDFTMDCDKFINTYGYIFSDTIGSLTQELRNRYEATTKTHRNQHVSYTGSMRSL